MYQKRNKHLSVLILYLGDYSKRLYLREISKLSKLPLKTTQTTLAYLEREKILKSSVHGKNKYFILNLDNPKTKLLLLEAESFKTFIFLEEYPLFKSFLKEIKHISAPIIIFGSFAKFTDTKSSDLDLLVISDKKIKLPFHLLPYKVHEINLSEKSFMKAFENNETLIKEISDNHIILNNHSFFINIWWDKYAK